MMKQKKHIKQRIVQIQLKIDTLHVMDTEWKMLTLNMFTVFVENRCPKVK